MVGILEVDWAGSTQRVTLTDDLDWDCDSLELSNLLESVCPPSAYRVSEFPGAGAHMLYQAAERLGATVIQRGRPKTRHSLAADTLG